MMVFSVLELTLESFHNFSFTALCPVKVNFINFRLIVQEPPVPRLEQGPNQHCIIAFADVYLV